MAITANFKPIGVKCEKTTAKKDVYKLPVKFSVGLESYSGPGGGELSAPIISQKDEMGRIEKQ